MWKPIETAPSGLAVMTKISDAKGDRNECVLTRSGRLWFAGSMHVYYEPTHWRELTPLEKLRIKNANERKSIEQMERANAKLGL